MATVPPDPDLELLTASLATGRLAGLVRALRGELAACLAGAPDAEALPDDCMLPAYAGALPTGAETGTYVAVDVGGSTVRVAVVQLAAGVCTVVHAAAAAITDGVRSLDGRSFFIWLASQLQSALTDAEGAGWVPPAVIPLGLAWSFPLEQAAVDSGTILTMGKGFGDMSAEMAGWDIKTVFVRACMDLDLTVDLRAVVNDTVSTVLAAAYADPRAQLALVLGTGFNAAAVVRAPGRPPAVINSELSKFSRRPGVLPATRWDAALDAASDAPGFQPLEQMVAGRYLGEIARRVLVDLVAGGHACGGRLPAGLGTPFGLESATMAAVEAAGDAEGARQQFLARHACRGLTAGHMAVVRAVFRAVASRAAALVAAALVALAETAGLAGADAPVVVVAATGAVVEQYPGFRGQCQQFLDLLGRGSVRLVLRPAPQAALCGPAVAAAAN
ncbi:uncharacterized protein V1510DRAFT_430838 [Dipodascopsis tothii]|uniref:uncharacterized protein n=1 Tax=Dipodascopsis tothii TaxID=44089 RepID=UPI0034CFB35A